MPEGACRFLVRMYAPAARRKSLAGTAARARAALHRRFAANGREGHLRRFDRPPGIVRYAADCSRLRYDTNSPVRGC